MNIPVNYWAVLACAVVYMAIGMVWYGPLFGKQWKKLMWLTDEKMKAMKGSLTKSMILGTVGALVMAQVLAHEQFVWFNFMGSTMGKVSFAAQLAFWLWLGFIATTHLSSVIWENRPWKLFFINSSAILVQMFVMALILTYWR